MLYKIRLKPFRAEIYAVIPHFTEQEAQLMLTTGSTRLAVNEGQQTQYHSICYIYCAIVTLSLRRAVFTIFVFKNVVTLKWGSKVTQGH